MKFSLLSKKEFRNFFLADIISGFGVGMTTVGANWYLLKQTGSNQSVGFYLTINVLSGFLMSPLAGMLTDRMVRKNVILGTFIGRAIPMILIAGFFWQLGFNLWLMYLLAVVTGAGWITYMAASRSYVQAILPDKLLGSANAFIEVSLQVGMFVAGAISGVILDYTGFLTILLVNIIVFVIAGGLLVFVKKDTKVAVTNKNTQKVNSSMNYIWKHKLILNVGILSILPLIVTQLFNVSNPDYVSTILKANSVVYGLADMGYGVGGLTAGLVTGFLIQKFANRRLIITFFSLAMVTLLFLFVGRFIPLLYLGTFLLGLSNSALRVVINTVLMRNVDQIYMGRVTATWNGLAQLIEVFASSFMGIFNDRLGANYGFLCMAIIMGVGTILSVFVLKPNRK